MSASMALSQLLRLLFTLSASALPDSARADEFLRALSFGNSIGRQALALSQPMSRRRRSSRICSAVTLMLSIYAAAILPLSSAFISCIKRSSSSDQYSAVRALLVSISRPHGVSPASSTRLESSSTCFFAQSSGRAWHCILPCSDRTREESFESSFPAPTVSASRRNPGYLSGAS